MDANTGTGNGIGIGTQIELRSDNTAGVAPEIMSALAAANSGAAPAYGDDNWTTSLRDVVREVFEHPTAEVFPVATGTAANSLSLSSLCPPWGAVLCHETAHIMQSEGGATSLLSGGAVMRGVGGDAFRIEPALLQAALDAVRWGDPHHSQPAVLSLTLPSDFGSVYTPAHVAELSEVARSRGMRTHIDGARIANAIAHLGCSPADITWRAGASVVSVGANKNGAMSTDVIVSFDESASAELVYRVKRAGHVASKMRFQSVQLSTYFTDGLWLRLAARANAAMTRLAGGLVERGVETVNDPVVNMLFARFGDDVISALQHEGVLFHRMGPGLARFVTSFQTTDGEVDAVLSSVDRVLSAARG